MSALAAWFRRTFAWSNSPQAWLDRAGVVGLIVGAAALVAFARHLSLAHQVLLWGLLVVAAAFTSRLFGPVLFYDLVRIARRNRYYIIRILYALFLLTMLCWVYFLFAQQAEPGSGGLRPDQAAKFANSFFYMFMAIQFLVVTTVTPAYVAGAIAEEKERKTLEFLLATDLHNREIVLSKLTSRLLNLMLLVLTGLPVLAALQFLGGVDPLLVIAGFTATLLTVASLAGLSILASTLCRRARDAIVLTYLLAVGYLALSGLSWLLTAPTGWASFPTTTSWTSPVTVQDLVEGLNCGNIVAVLIEMSIDVNTGGQVLDVILPGYLRNYALFHGAIAFLGPLWAVLRLRGIALNETSEPARRQKRLFRLWPRLRVGRYPMIWKEVFSDPGIRLHWLGRAVVWFLVLASFVPVAIIGYQIIEGTLDSPLRFFGNQPDAWTALAENTQLWVVRVAGTAVASLLLMAVAVRAASTISIERDRQTFDSLLTTPLGSDAILFGKWLGAMVSVRRGWLWLGALWGIGVLTGGLHPLAFLLLIGTWLVYAAFLAGLGTWFSTVSRSTLSATTWTLLCTVAAALGHWLIWLCCIPIMIARSGPAPDALEYIAKFQAGLTPIVNLGFNSSFSWRDVDAIPHHLDETAGYIGYGFMGTLTWAVLALALWGLTRRRFREITLRTPFEPEREVRPRRKREHIEEVVPVDEDTEEERIKETR